jgi:DNA invertase Pin-like site-specific DNA recombinase
MNPVDSNYLQPSKGTFRIPRMILGYARVSAGDKTPTTQRDALLAAGCETVFTDLGIGRRLPELDRALKRLQPGDVLVVRKLDRLGRGLNDMIENVKRIEERGAHLRSIEDAIDTTAKVGRSVFQVIAAIAAVDRSHRGERARNSMKAAKQRGQHVGRPPKLKPEQVLKASERISNGEEPADVARDLGVSPLTLRRALHAQRNTRPPPRRRQSA